MKPVIFAVLTAICWSVGGFFEKRGLHLGNLTPVMGITFRTAVALLILGLVSIPHWGSLKSAGNTAILYLLIGGGVVAGSLGMLCFYTGIGTGHLSKVMPIAFGLTPVIGYIMGVTLLNEPSSPIKIMGIVLTVAGVICIGVK